MCRFMTDILHPDPNSGGNKMRVLFVDDRMDEISRMWRMSLCSEDHELLPLKPFCSVEQTLEEVRIYQPDVIMVGYGLGKEETGVEVIVSKHSSRVVERRISKRPGTFSGT